MRIKNARFIQSLDVLKPYPGQGAPEIAMAGKSNVGKSSVINRLTHNGRLARVSGEPGKTRLINLFDINDGQMILVDLPGYGFARAPQTEKARWAGMIEGYLSGSAHLKHVIQLVDIRHDPTADDQKMVEYLRYYHLPFTVVANKCDKLSRPARARAIPAICRALAVQPWQVLPFSAEDGTGEDAVLELLERILTPEGTEIQ